MRVRILVRKYRRVFLIIFQKKKSTWRIYVWYYNTYLNTTYGCDCVWWFACVDAKSLDGDSYVPKLNWNDDKQNLDRNRWGNEWNDGCRFVCVRNLISLHSTKAKPSCYVFLRIVVSSCFTTWLCHPPNIFPISCNFSVRVTYCFVSNALMLCEIRRSTFAVSSV